MTHKTENTFLEMNANFLFFITGYSTSLYTKTHKNDHFILRPECIDDEHFCMHDLVNFNGINEWVNEIECEIWWEVD